MSPPINDPPELAAFVRVYHEMCTACYIIGRQGCQVTQDWVSENVSAGMSQITPPPSQHMVVCRPLLGGLSFRLSGGCVTCGT